MDRDELSGDLERLAASTAAIDAAPEITDAVMARVKASGPAADALAQIAAATASIDAAPEIADAVMARVAGARPAPTWIDGVVRAGPAAVIAAAMIAAASLALFFTNEGVVDATLATAADAMEVLE